MVYLDSTQYPPKLSRKGIMGIKMIDEEGIFKELYSEFTEEVEGVSLMCTNNSRVGYDREYKKLLFKLCQQYHQKIMDEKRIRNEI